MFHIHAYSLLLGCSASTIHAYSLLLGCFASTIHAYSLLLEYSVSMFTVYYWGILHPGSMHTVYYWGIPHPRPMHSHYWDVPHRRKQPSTGVFSINVCSLAPTCPTSTCVIINRFRIQVSQTGISSIKMFNALSRPLTGVNSCPNSELAQSRFHGIEGSISNGSLL